MEQYGLEVTFDGETSGLTAAAKQAGTALAGFRKQTADSTRTLIDLSRVAQDAPYGFIGIANNLNPLMESFQRLQKETGSTKAAFSSLAQGLGGAGGLGLALGVASSLLISFGGDMLRSKSETEDHKAALDAFAESLKDGRREVDSLASALRSLQQIGEINLKIAGLPGSLGKASNVVDIDETILKTKNTLDGFLEQQKELNALINYSEGKLSELEKTPGVFRAIEDFFDADDTPNYGKKIQDAKEKLKLLEVEIKNHYEKLAQLDRDRKVASAMVREAEFDELVEANKKAEGERKKYLTEYQKWLNDYKAAWEDFQTWMRKYKGQHVSGVYDNFPVPTVPTSKPPAGDITGNFFLTEQERNQTPFDPNPINDNITRTAQILSSWQAKFQKMNIRMPAIDYSAAIESNDEFLTRMYQQAQSIQAIIQNLKMEMTTALGEGIGEALAGNGLKEAITPMFNAIGSALTELGKTLIVTGTGIETFKESFKTLNGIGAIAAGVGMVALGTVMKSKIANIKAFADGGIVSSPTLGVFGEYAGARNNPEIVAPLNRLKSLLGDVGGGGGFIARTEIEADKLILLVERGKRKQGRTR